MWHILVVVLCTYRCVIVFVGVVLQGMGERLQSHQLFKSMNEDQQEDLMDCIEKHIMTDLYSW